MRGLDLNNKKIILVIFEFSILREEIIEFRKIRIFKHSSAINYSTKKKFHMKVLVLKRKQFFNFRF